MSSSRALALLVMSLGSACAEVPPPTAGTKSYDNGLAALGESIFFDSNLSSPPGQSCATCHAAQNGYTDPRAGFPTSQGTVAGRFGNRNAPSAAYLSFCPPFHFSDEDQSYEGGLFWDGRVNSLEEQMQKPLLNPLEMNNPDVAAVVAEIRVASYAPELQRIFGPDSLDDPQATIDNVSQAVAAYEQTPALQPFSSKYDRYLEHKAVLTQQELRGLELFDDPKKGNCFACHPSTVGLESSTHALFTDFTYDNIGIPRNPNNPYYDLTSDLNPQGAAYVDHGLGAILNDPSQDGRFRVPTLRNIALTAPYGHNGYFADLKTIVRFYNSRDTDSMWAAPEVPGTVNRDELGHLGMSDQDIDDLVAFLTTLTDGY